MPLPGGIRVYGHDFGVDERSGLFGGFADYMELLPETLVEPLPDDIPADGAHGLGAARHRRPLGDRGQARRTRWRSSGPGTSAWPRSWRRGRPAPSGSSSPALAADALRLDAARGLGVEEAIDISAADPVERIRELTGDGVDVVIDAASGSTSTVTQGMQMARRGGTVVIGGLKDRKPVDGFISDWIPMRQLHLHAGFPGDHVKTSVELIRQGQVPTAALLGEAVTVDGLGDALRLLARNAPRPRRDPPRAADGRTDGAV